MHLIKKNHWKSFSGNIHGHMITRSTSEYHTSISKSSTVDSRHCDIKGDIEKDLDRETMIYIVWQQNLRGAYIPVNYNMDNDM